MTRRAHRPYTRRDALHGFLLRLGLYASLGAATWVHWWHVSPLAR